MTKKPTPHGNIIVTGGAGFIGSSLSEELVRLGYTVHVIDNLSYGKARSVPKGSTLHIVDICDKQALEKVFRSIKKIHCLFHCAALPRVQFSIDNPEISHNVNVNGTIHLLELCRKYNVSKFIYSASSSAYGDQKNIALHENILPDPKSPYAAQKYFGELACGVYSKVYGLKTVSLRYFNVYGPKQDPDGAYAMVIARFISQKKNSKPMTITGSGNQTRDFVYISDVVNANIKAMTNPRIHNGEVINIGSGISTSINQIAKIIGGNKIYIESRIEPQNTRADIKKAKRVLGWAPKINITSGIQKIQKELGLA